MTTCPKCNYARQPSDTAPDWQCPNCGVAYAKAAAATAPAQTARPGQRPATIAVAGAAAAGAGDKSVEMPEPEAGQPGFRARIAAALLVITAICAWELRSDGHLVAYRGVIFAILIPVWLYVFLKYALLPIIYGSAHKGTPAPEASADSTKRIGLAGIIGRVVVYGLLGYVAILYLYRVGNVSTSMSVEECNRNQFYCVDNATGILKSIRKLEDDSKPLGGKPRIACELVSAWLQHDISGFPTRVEFQDSGTFDGVFVTDGGKTRRAKDGLWAVQGDNLVWRSVHAGSGTLEISKIQWDGPNRLTLVEQNGEKSYFERDLPLPKTRCTK
jgi:hypothetical protein